MVSTSQPSSLTHPLGITSGGGVCLGWHAKLHSELRKAGPEDPGDPLSPPSRTCALPSAQSDLASGPGGHSAAA